MKGFVLGVVVTVLALAGGVFAVARFGWYPIGADNPPGALERRLASRALDAYADAHKPAGDNPMPPTAANLLDGAREYEEHCALCHGGAAAKISPLQNKFNPPVPQLVNRIPHDDDAWLFWVTKHGVRMTGMPTWDGILTDDEMWKVIAFIKHSNALPPEVDAAWRAMAVKRESPEEPVQGPAAGSSPQ